MSDSLEQFNQFLASENVVRHLRRFYKHMPPMDDVMVSVLKGHLLIEEQLFGLIATQAEKPQALKDSRLTFHQALCIAECLLWYKDSDWVWSCCRMLNGIRNGLSHQLEPSKIKKQITEFLDAVEKHYPPHGKKNIRGSPEKPLLMSIGMVYVYLAAYLEACRNSKQMKEKKNIA
ncbi:MAG: hypothetical protein CVU64_03205 [Deltaproteobacteria bacterium HGW-Deltaproteobacteria-21]|nr:MAG: hypothetical protein CVU64_03205 [Deltaproteobacteria bacterium HGW-Deltaproteobacteria-21]